MLSSEEEVVLSDMGEWGSCLEKGADCGQPKDRSGHVTPPSLVGTRTRPDTVLVSLTATS